ncbi:MAG: sigma-70 family RNA polymerase sigma factor [Gemmataceae bacterium]|nr:sigma-70 family RNA polymerase sigma factor [Gemmataceae bacterium]
MSRQDATSLTLLQRLQGQDDAAWSRFAFLYRPLIVYWCGRWNVMPADEDDLVQEVMKAVHTHLPDFERLGESGSFRAWLRGITRNKLLEYDRRRRTRLPVAEGGSDAQARLNAVADSAPALDEGPAELAGLYMRAAEAIRGDFNDQTWQIFWRTTVESQSPAQVATDLGLKPAAVRMAKARVLRRLREQVGDFADGEQANGD